MRPFANFKIEKTYFKEISVILTELGYIPPLCGDSESVWTTKIHVALKDIKYRLSTKDTSHWKNDLKEDKWDEGQT